MKGLSIIVLFVFITKLGISQNIPVDSIKISKENYISNFNQINEYVSKNYTHIESKNINIDSLAKDYSSRIEKIDEKNQYINLLMEYFGELRNSHTNLYFERYHIDCSAKLVEQTLFISSVEDSVFINSGIRKNDEIIRIDNLEALDWLRKEERFISSSTEKDRLNSTIRRVFNSEFRGPRTYDIKTKDGVKTISIAFDSLWKYIPLKIKATNCQIYNDSIGYVAINSMQGDVVNEFKADYKKIADLPYLIIDIRNNGGGNSNNGEKINSFLITNVIRASVSHKILKPNANHYKGKLYVLINVNTFSAAESFALDLYESGDATLIGGCTGGDTGNRPRIFETDCGIKFRIPTRKPPQVSFHGFPMEGKGVKPHFEVELTKEDYLNGIDTVLEFTIGKIIKNEKTTIPN